MFRKRHNGFTLVELLVVIGIIAVLIGVLLPALNNARSQAKSVQCLSQLRQIGLGLIMYANANKGHVPPTRFNRADQPSGSYDGIFWANFLHEGKYVVSKRDSSGVFMCPNATDEIETNYYADPGQRTTNSGYFNMRGSKNPDGTKDNSDDIKCSYAVNGFFSNADAPWWNGDAYNGGPNAKYYSTLFPFVIIDLSANSPEMRPDAPKVFGKVASNIGMVFDGFFMHAMDGRRIKLRHGNQRGKVNDRIANFVFADGHADSIRGGRLPATNSDMFTPSALNNTSKWDVQFSPISN